MAKLDAFKEKISQAQNSVSEKLDKIALFKKWKESRAQKNTGPSSHSLGEIYRQGGPATRLQVLLIYAFILAAIFFTFQSGRKMFIRLGKSVENEKLKADYSHGIGDLAQRVVEKANLVSMGKFTTNVFQPGRANAMLGADIWIRVSNPAAAEFAQKNETLIHDGIVNGLSQAHRDELNPLTEEGSEATKGRIIEALNKIMEHGKVEEVFFHNLVVQ